MSDIREQYKEEETKSLERRKARLHRQYTQEEIRSDVNKLFEKVNQGKLLLSSIGPVLRTMRYRYKSIKYSEVRSAILYAGMFTIQTDTAGRSWVYQASKASA